MSWLRRLSQDVYVCHFLERCKDRKTGWYLFLFVVMLSLNGVYHFMSEPRSKLVIVIMLAITIVCMIVTVWLWVHDKED